MGGRSFSDTQTLADPIVDIKIQNLESGIAKRIKSCSVPGVDRPRVVSGKLVLCRSSWRVSQDELKPLGQVRGAVRIRSVQMTATDSTAQPKE